MKSKKKPIIGILGGIGSGKSTVTAEFVKLGCKAINADEIAHEVMQQQPVKSRISEKFGDDIFHQGQIDRHKLAHIAFADGDKLRELNKIVHPEVLGRCEQLIAEYQSQEDTEAVILDMPLLLEVGWADKCDILIFVTCEYKTRLERVQRKGNFDENKLKIRENFQISLDTKARISDIIIENNSTLLELSQQVASIFVNITRS